VVSVYFFSGPTIALPMGSEDGSGPCGSFDWLVPFEDLRAFLAPEWTGQPLTTPVLVVGCGNSTLGAELVGAGYRRVLNIDTEAGVVAAMWNRHRAEPGLVWLHGDFGRDRQLIRVDIGDAVSLVGEAAVGVAVDKGTLDAMLCGGLASVARYLVAIRSSLAPDGVLVIVSLYPADLLVPFLSLPGDPFRVTHRSLPHRTAWCGLLGGPSPVSVVTLRRLPGPSIDAGTVERHLQRVLDTFAQDRHPLLTDQECARIRECFETCRKQSPSPHEAPPSLPLSLLHGVLFPADGPLPPQEYPLPDFLGDWAAFAGHSNDLRPTDRASLDDALRFLRTMQ
jgi:SAM-dependent methyltransferase